MVYRMIRVVEQESFENRTYYIGS